MFQKSVKLCRDETLQIFDTHPELSKQDTDSGQERPHPSSPPFCCCCCQQFFFISDKACMGCSIKFHSSKIFVIYLFSIQDDEILSFLPPLFSLAFKWKVEKGCIRVCQPYISLAELKSWNFKKPIFFSLIFLPMFFYSESPFYGLQKRAK